MCLYFAVHAHLWDGLYTGYNEYICVCVRACARFDSISRQMLCSTLSTLSNMSVSLSADGSSRQRTHSM